MTLYNLKSVIDNHTAETLEDTCRDLRLLIDNTTPRLGIFYCIRNIHKLFKTAFTHPQKLKYVCGLFLHITHQVTEYPELCDHYEEWICRIIATQMMKMNSDMTSEYMNGLRIILLCIHSHPERLYCLHPIFYSHLLKIFSHCPSGETKNMFAEIVSVLALKHVTLNVNVFNNQIYECMLLCVDTLHTDVEMVQSLLTILTIACMRTHGFDRVRERLVNVWTLHNIKAILNIASSNDTNPTIKKCVIRISEFAWSNCSSTGKVALLKVIEPKLNEWFEDIPRLSLLVWNVIIDSIPDTINFNSTMDTTLKFIRGGLNRYELMQCAIQLLVSCIQREHPIINDRKLFQNVCNSVYKLAHYVEIPYLITLMELWLTYSFRHDLKYNEYANIAIKQLAAFADSPESTRRIMSVHSRLMNVSLFSKCCAVIQKDPFLSNDTTYQFLLHPDYIFDISEGDEDEDDDSDYEDEFTPVLLF